MANERKMMMAKDIVKNPVLLKEYTGKYVVICDSTMTDLQCHNLNNAICILADEGWRAVNIAVTSAGGVSNSGHFMYVLMERYSSESFR